MIRLNTGLRLLFILTAMHLLVACDREKDVIPDDVLLHKLDGVWLLQRATENGDESTHAFSGLTLTLRKSRTYTVKNGLLPLWPEQGTFLEPQPEDSHRNLYRSDGINMAVAEVTEDNLKLFIFYQNADKHRKEERGEYLFTFAKIR